MSLTFGQATADALGQDFDRTLNNRNRLNPDVVQALIVLPKFHVGADL